MVGCPVVVVSSPQSLRARGRLLCVQIEYRGGRERNLIRFIFFYLSSRGQAVRTSSRALLHHDDFGGLVRNVPLDGHGIRDPRILVLLHLFAERDGHMSECLREERM